MGEQSDFKFQAAAEGIKNKKNAMEKREDLKVVKEGIRGLQPREGKGRKLKDRRNHCRACTSG